jgi:hypothetical protein
MSHFQCSRVCVCLIGLSQTAAMLQKEASLPRPATPPIPHPVAAQCYPQTVATPKLVFMHVMRVQYCHSLPCERPVSGS